MYLTLTEQCQNTSTPTDSFGYLAQAGYITDAATGLCLTTFRYYDPGNGRFLNRDPSGYGGGIDLYSYVQNNSENKFDPLGYGGVASPGSGDHRIGNHCNSPCLPNPHFDIAIGILVGIVVGLVLAFYSGGLWAIANPIVACMIAAISTFIGGEITNILDNCGDLPNLSQLLDDGLAAAGACLGAYLPPVLLF